MKSARALLVDLTNRRATFETLSALERRRLGGAALGVTLHQRLASPGAGPLDPGSPWILSVGPLTGTALSPRPQAAITHLSPLTGGINDSVITHPAALGLAANGARALVLLGMSETPVWLRISEDGVEFMDARALWGSDLPDAAAVLRTASGSTPLVVGTAAEHAVHFACLGSEGHSAGRGGSGAALASKRVKGIAIPGPAGGGGTAPPGAARERDPRGPRALDRLRLLNQRLGLPTRNFTARSFEGTETLAAALAPLAEARRVPYEGVFAFGPLLGIPDASAVLRCLDQCDRLGLDVISAGGTLAWGMEAAEAGALDAPGLRFGEPRGLERRLESIARRRDEGELLALGCRTASERLGRGSEAWAMHVRGLEIPGYDPRAFPTLALGYAVGSRGACHVRSGAYQADFDEPLPDPPDAGELARRAADFEDRSTLLDSLIVSRSWRTDLGEPFTGAARLLREAGETDLADPEALRATMGEVADLRRRINLDRGWTAAGDVLPQRLLRNGGNAVPTIDATRLQSWVRAYYARRGWDAGGRPASPGSAPASPA